MARAPDAGREKGRITPALFFALAMSPAPPPRGLDFATATPSAAFFPHLEQRIRGASSVSVTFQPTRRERLGLNLAARGALAQHAHQEITEAVVQPLDVR
jgi:hypothetical protein